jgi:hypothetical protein
LAFAAVYGLPDKPAERTAADLPAKAMEKFAGEYLAPQVGRVTVRVEGDHLVISNDRIGSALLYPAAERRFFSLGEIPDLAFTVAESGDVTGFESGGVVAKRTK